MAIRTMDGYSSSVAIHLEIDGQRLDVAQIGPDSLILRSPTEIAPSTSATLVINIDGRIERDEIVLHEGATKDMVLIPYF
jgi:hypothetical protein